MSGLLAWPADHLTEAADYWETVSERSYGVARGGASDLTAARSRVRYAVDDGCSAGFVVGEDLSVRDRMVGGSGAQRASCQVCLRRKRAHIPLPE
ncbi:hypothetical protein A5702_10420 [Mycobacterium sp. E3339]|nr:hypothetical protein A5702_10420 [Mycobacterium sp. E3339]